MLQAVEKREPPRRMPTKRDIDWKPDPARHFTSGESQYDNTRADFMTLQGMEREEHLKELWR